MVKNSLLLIQYYFKISSVLKSKGIDKIQLFNFQDWHHGYAYFLGEHKSKKVFIKVDTKLHLLENDILAYDICKESLEDSLAQVVDFYTNDNMQIIVYEYLYGELLSEELLLASPNILEQIVDALIDINRLGIIHRDIKLNNFFVVDNKIKIIDFTFANSLKNNNKFKELNLNIRMNCKILSFLGMDLNPQDFEWNDFYHMKTILEKIIQAENKQMEASTKNMLEKYIQKFKELEADNTYKIKCNSKYYFFEKKIKRYIKSFLRVGNYK